MKNPERTTVARFASIGTQLPELIELFDYVEDIQVWVKDRQGRFVWGNVSWLLTFGLSKDLADHVGLTDFDLFVEVLASQYRIDDDKVLHGERILARVELVGRFDHAARWYATTKIPLHNADGRIVGTVGMTRPLEGERSAVPGNSPVSAAILYASEHLDEPLSNHALARACGLSVRVFERLFQTTYNTTPHLYVRQLRVRMSSRALVFTQKSLVEIATQFGFADQSHFTKEFRRFMDTTPRVYRQQYQRRSTWAPGSGT